MISDDSITTPETTKGIRHEPASTPQNPAIAAIAFGALTVLRGGRGPFGVDEERASPGNIVGFARWFNFLAGFVYVLTGAGLWLDRGWA